MDPKNEALWLPKRGGRLTVGPAPYTHPEPHQVVVCTAAVAVNPVDNLPGIGYRVAMPWLTFPAVIGGDVAGEVVATGADVTRLRVGDRVIGMATGIERDRNRASEGAFQRYVVLDGRMVSPIPRELTYEAGVALPLTLSTAATGLFQPDHLGLTMPSVEPTPQQATVLVWGGSTSVGSNAIQLARAAGYRVITTASPRNFDYVRSLGAAVAFDYHHSSTAVEQIVDALDGDLLAGTLAIGARSLPPAITIASKVSGGERIASVRLGMAERHHARRQRGKAARVTLVWGGTLRHNEVGPGIYAHFLPEAFRNGTYRPAPDALLAGHGLGAIPDALRQLRAGVSAKKLVVTI